VALAFSVIGAGNDFEFFPAGTCSVGFFNNLTGHDVNGLLLRFAAPAPETYAIAIGGDMDVVSVDGGDVMLQGTLRPLGTCEVDWCSTGYPLQSAAWVNDGEVVQEIDVHVPTARFVACAGSSPLAVRLLALGSIDPDGQPLESYFWELDNGRQAEGYAVHHEFGEAGCHFVRLTVTDAEGKTASLLKCVWIREDESGSQGGEAGRILYVHTDGGTAPTVMVERLSAVGYTVTVMSSVPPNTAAFDGIVVHANLGEQDAERLEQFAAAGGGVVLLEASAYYMGMANVGDWVGASGYTNASRDTPAVTVGENPFGSSFDSYEEVVRSAVDWGGAAAMEGLALAATPVAIWDEPGVLSYAHTHPHELGRVYYQAQLGGEEVSEAAWELLLSGLGWAVGTLDTVFDLQALREDWELGSIDPATWKVRSEANAKCEVRDTLAHNGMYSLFMSDHVGGTGSWIAALIDFASPYAEISYWEYIDRFTGSPPQGELRKHILGDAPSDWAPLPIPPKFDAHFQWGDNDVGYLEVTGREVGGAGTSMIRWHDGAGQRIGGIELPGSALWDQWEHYTVKVMSELDKILIYHGEDLVMVHDTLAAGEFRTFVIGASSNHSAGPDIYLDEIEIEY
jgi:hypothetical protein